MDSSDSPLVNTGTRLAFGLMKRVFMGGVVLVEFFGPLGELDGLGNDLALCIELVSFNRDLSLLLAIRLHDQAHLR